MMRKEDEVDAGAGDAALCGSNEQQKKEGTIYKNFLNVFFFRYDIQLSLEN